MKKIIFIVFGTLLLVFNACKRAPVAADVKKEVLNIHDKLMIDGESVVKNRMKLDSVLKSGSVISQGDSVKISSVINQLNQADESMMDWMHFFKDDYKGETEGDDLNYYKSEMIKIRSVEDYYIKAINKSDSILKSYHIALSHRTKADHQKH